MALIKCPECGRKNVSDTASACPQCGFNIMKYVLEQQTLTNSKEKSSNSQNNKTKHRVFMTVVFCIIVVIILLAAYFKKKDNEIISNIKTASVSINLIEKSLEIIDDYLEDGDYIYGSIKSDVAIKYITQNLDYIDDYIKDVNKYYEKYDTQICRGIDEYVKENTEYNSWHDLSFALYANYYIKDTNSDSADALVRGISYSSFDKLLEGQKNKIAPEIGMTEADVKKSIWGEAQSIYPDTEGNGEMWGYDDGRLIYFKNGIVTRIID